LNKFFNRSFHNDVYWYVYLGIIRNRLFNNNFNLFFNNSFINYCLFRCTVNIYVSLCLQNRRSYLSFLKSSFPYASVSIIRNISIYFMIVSCFNINHSSFVFRYSNYLSF
jgi:hypothetical protein